MTRSCDIDGCSNPSYARGMCCAHYKRHLKTRPPGTSRPRQAPADGELTLTARTSLPELLAALAAAVPPLKGARCRSHAQLFDRTVWQHDQPNDTREARDVALGICQDCPALPACRAWLDTLPADHKPIGVVAGQIVNPTEPPSLKSQNAHRADRFNALNQSGMSVGEIAAVTGFSTSTVRRALSYPRVRREGTT